MGGLLNGIRGLWRGESTQEPFSGVCFTDLLASILNKGVGSAHVLPRS